MDSTALIGFLDRGGPALWGDCQVVEDLLAERGIVVSYDAD